ncbi:MAG: Maf family protein [Kofleriaceae bacterium]
MSVLLLASASPRRRELLERIGIAIEVHPADVDEGVQPGEPPAAYVTRIARAKADAVVARVHPAGFVLAADTTVTIDGRILAKAETDAEAAAMLGPLAGRTHEVLTAFTVIGPQVVREVTVSTAVTMVDFDAATLAAYVATGEWRGKAGAYAIQGIAGSLVREIRGSVTNVIGLPVAEVVAVLRELGGPLPNFVAGRPM